MTDYLIAAAIIAASAAGGYAGLMHKKASNIEVEDVAKGPPCQTPTDFP